MNNENKRQLDRNTSADQVWHDAVSWIERNGGYIHPRLCYDGTRRCVYVGGPADGNSAAAGAECSGAITTGTNLLEIPDPCLITLHAAEADAPFGRSLFGTARMLARRNGDDEAILYHDAQDVILALFLAHLRRRLERTTQRSSSTDVALAPPSTPEWFYRPYLDTLFPSSKSPADSAQSDACDFSRHLPRQWSAATLRRRLLGTSLYGRVLREQEGIRREYGAMKQAWVDCGTGSSAPPTEIDSVFPSFECYSEMMAVITSRSFSGFGRDGVDALVPLLDLLNHVRGRKVGRARDGYGDREDLGRAGNSQVDEGGPDVRYSRYEQDREDGDAARATKKPRTEDGTSEGGGVRVRAARLLPNGTVLHMTYGAKGNAALLGRYGFCVPDNVEPDGSCNDVLELEVVPRTPPVELQRGPKAYCYSPFIRALDLCRDVADERCKAPGEGMGSPKSPGEGGKQATKEEFEAFLDLCDDLQEGGKRSTEDEFEDFLDSCDDLQRDNIAEIGDENDDDGNLHDVYYRSTSSNTTTRAAKLDQTSLQEDRIKSDLRALDALTGVLQNTKANLAKNTLADSLLNHRDSRNATNGSTDLANEDKYCAILVRSEMQTLNFYLATADALRRHLAPLSATVEPRPPAVDECTSKQQGNSTIAEQVRALVNVFLSIRYPQLMETILD